MNENPYNTPKSQLYHEHNKKGFADLIMLNLLRHWNGRAKLSTAFWGHFLAGNLLFSIAIAIISGASSKLVLEPFLPFTIFQYGLVTVSIIYNICTIRFIWACAGNSNYSVLFYIARGLILAIIIFLISIFALTFYDAVSFK